MALIWGQHYTQAVFLIRFDADPVDADPVDADPVEILYIFHLLFSP